MADPPGRSVERRIPANHNPFNHFDRSIISIDTLKGITPNERKLLYVTITRAKERAALLLY